MRIDRDLDGDAAFSVTRQILLYGLLGGVLIFALRLIEYRFLVIEHSLEMYGGLVAVIFVALGLWLGQRLRDGTTATVPATEPRVSLPLTGVTTDSAEAQRTAMGVTRRELEILQLMADGLSNREIAQRLFVSENTVKTHSSRLFEKLDARRRTQAVQRGKVVGLLP